VVEANTLLELFQRNHNSIFYAGLGRQTSNLKGKDVLEIGMDYVIDDIPLEANFNIQLGESIMD
jgi:hypothetical protein